MSQSIQWGILGTGNIARQFCNGMKEADTSLSIAVASRDQTRADEFANQFEIPKAYDNYQSLLEDPDVQAIYLSLPNHLHHEWSIRALEAGKHVLCEKPIAMKASHAMEMFEVAESCDRLLMEAFMYQCHPMTIKMLETLRSGVIGEVQLVKTSFSFYLKSLENNIRNIPEYGGGALMDVGCYCVSLARLATGEEPIEALAHSQFTASGVDLQTMGLLTFPSGAQASLVCGMAAQTDNSAYICGDQGYLSIPVPWKPQPQSSYFEIHTMSMPKQDQLKLGAKAQPSCERIEVPMTKNLYAYEIDAFAKALLGETDAPVSPENSIGNMQVLDRLRDEIGLIF